MTSNSRQTLFRGIRCNIYELYVLVNSETFLNIPGRISFKYGQVKSLPESVLYVAAVISRYCTVNYFALKNHKFTTLPNNVTLAVHSDMG